MFSNVKRGQQVEDPFVIATDQYLRVLPTGELVASTTSALRLVLFWDLYSPAMVQWRTLWLRIVYLGTWDDEKLHRELLRLPDLLPRLGRLKPPGGNSHPHGVIESWAAKADRAEFPDVY